MARGGINRAVVKIARDGLLARGLKPTIDAIRIELGNTGSKSTIIRCLRELDHVELQRQPPSLEEELSVLIGSVAGRVREEAEASVASERELLTREQNDYRTQRQQALSRIEELQSLNAALAAQLKEQRILEIELQERLRVSEVERVRLSAIEQTLGLVSAEHAKQITSLEEKNQHARQSLEHYRQSQKEQRDQEIKRNDERTQLLQLEIKSLKNILMQKQEDITHLYRDNERLVEEVRNNFKRQQEWESELIQQRKSFETGSQALKKERDTLQERLIALSIENAAIQERLRQRQFEFRQYRRLLKNHAKSVEVKAGIVTSP